MSRVKLKFGLTNSQGVDNSKGQSAADKIIVVSYVSWSISLNGWMQANEARRRITSTPYLSSLLKHCQLINFLAGKSSSDINYISVQTKFIPFSVYLHYVFLYILYNTIIIICTYNFLSRILPLLKKFFSIFLNIFNVVIRRKKRNFKWANN